jgi:hypothetical protein
MCEQFFGGQGGGLAAGNPFESFIQGLEQRQQQQQVRPQSTPIVPRVQNAQPMNPAQLMPGQQQPNQGIPPQRPGF